MSEPIRTDIPDVPVMRSENVNVIQILMCILRGKRTILLAGLVFALCGLVLALWLRPQFTANAEILPPQQSQGVSTAAMLSQVNAASSMGSIGGIASAIQAKTAADMYAAMISARPVEDALIQRYGLKSVYHANTMTAARLGLESHSAITSTKDGFITIAVTDTDRQRAMNLANGYIEELRNLMHGLALTGASQRRIFYEGQLVKAKDDLEHAEVAFKQMQQGSRMIMLDAQSRTLIEGAAELRAKVAAKEVELQGLRAYSTEENPQVQIEEKELAALRSQESQMDANSQGSYSGVGLSSVPDAELSYVRASRELKYQEELYDLLVKQYEGSRIDEAQEAPIVQVIEPAILPEVKSGPRRGFIVIASFFFGLIIGILIVLYRAWRSELDQSSNSAIRELLKAAFQWSS